MGGRGRWAWVVLALLASSGWAQFGTEAGPLVVQPPSGGPVAGLVVDPEGRPVVGARVMLLQQAAANSYDVEAKDAVINQVRDLFGLNQDGGTVAIKSFAPAMTWRPKAPPLPQNENAQRYGVQWNGFWSPGN